MDNLTRKMVIGRERILGEITRGVLSAQPQSFSLVGPKLLGKSTLLKYLTDEEGPLTGEWNELERPAAFAEGGLVIPVWIDCEWPDAQQDLLGWLYKNVLDEVRERRKLPLPWHEIEREVSAGRRIWQISRQLTERDFRLVLLLDNFDRIFKSNLIRPETVDELRPLTLGLALVVATDQPLHDLDRELAASPLFNVMHQLFLGLLDADSARKWIHAFAAITPGVKALAGPLLELSGNHPFLLKRLGDSLYDLQQLLPPGVELALEHLPLLRLRLAEHGRLLFETSWRALQDPPARIRSEVVDALLRRLLVGLVPLESVPMEQAGALNWLINQAVVVCCVTPDASGYELFSPLFKEYLARRLQAPAVSRDLVGETTAFLPADQLTKTELSLMRYFQARPHQVVSPEQLLTEVWKRPDETNPRRVQEAIRRLRMQLEKIQPPIGDIENDRGRGYRFVPAA